MKRAARDHGTKRAVVAAGIALALAGLVVGAARADAITDLNAKVKALDAALQAHTAVPVGSIVAYGGTLSDDARNRLRAQGWLACDGTAQREDDYPALYAAIGTAFGGDKGTQTFNLPDFRGRFLRGVDHGAGNDPDREQRVATGIGKPGDHVGSVQADAWAAHSHQFDGQASGIVPLETREAIMKRHDVVETHQLVSLQVTVMNVNSNNGGAETRPKNVYVEWLIYAGTPAKAAPHP